MSLDSRNAQHDAIHDLICRLDNFLEHFHQLRDLLLKLRELLFKSFDPWITTNRNLCWGSNLRYEISMLVLIFGHCLLDPFRLRGLPVLASSGRWIGDGAWLSTEQTSRAYEIREHGKCHRQANYCDPFLQIGYHGAPLDALSNKMQRSGVRFKR